MNIIIIIVSFNSEKWIRKNLDSIGRGEDILVIDNGSSDNTLEIIKTEFPYVRLIESKINLGFAKANNIGFEIVKKENYDWVFLVNHDAWLHDNSLMEIKNVLSNPEFIEFGILSPVHLSGDCENYDYGFKRFCNIEQLIQSQNSNESLFEVNEVNGAFMLISNKCIKKLKGFDPLFFFYGEDIDFCFRARKNDIKIGIITKAIAFHDRKNRKEDFNRKKNRIIANHLIQFKQINSGFRLSYYKTIYSALIGLALNYKDKIYYFEVLKYFIYRKKLLKVAYKEYN